MIKTNGLGDVKAFSLNARDRDVGLKGSGDTKLNVNGHMEVDINGSRNVHYKGKPTILEVNENESGDVRNAN